MEKFELKIYSILLLLALILVNPITLFAESSAYYQKQIDSLKAETAKKNSAIQEARNKKAEYESIINEKRNESLTLQNQKEEIQGLILKAKFDIIEVENSIEMNNLELKTLELEIKQTEAAIAEQKEKIAELVKMIYKNDSKGILDILFLNDSISEFFDQIKYTESINDGLAIVLEGFKENKEKLENKKLEIAVKTQELEVNKIELDVKNETLQNEKDRLARLIKETEDQEDKFQKILAQQILEEKLIQAEINNIQKQINSATGLFKSAKQKEETEKKLLSMGGAISNNSLEWPVPSKYVTAYYKDPSYPYKSTLGDHPAIDIRASQGTAIKAPAAGYVTKVADNGYGYSYIMLMHANNVSTLYGHVSGFNVKVGQYVNTGDVIGYSGGTPGTRGAGPFTTGAHLHFEVRVSGSTVNPLTYLKIK